MTKPLTQNILFWIFLLVFLTLWSFWVVSTHKVGAIVSWDEGFHGGSALYLTEIIRSGFKIEGLGYIRDDFLNGLIWYPPLWLIPAGVMGSIFGPSVEIYRLTTLLFALGSVLMISLFVKSIKGIRAGIITALTLALTPSFIVYSHLMMREVPLLFAVSAALLAFYRYITLKKITAWDLLLTAVAFIVGVQAKIVGIGIVFGVVILVTGLVYFRAKKSLSWKRIQNRWMVYFSALGIGSFFLYRLIILKFLRADMILFYLGQNSEMTKDNSFFPLIFIKTMFSSVTFYMQDFMHMPVWSSFLVSALIGYVIFKRNFLSFFLLIWVFVTYFIFSAVKPQAPLYLLSIYAPLSIAAGLFWGEIFSFKSSFLTHILFVFLAAGIISTNLLNLKNTETWMWRDLITNQDKAVEYVVAQSEFGDRVVSSGDGTRFLLRLAGFDKKIQTINGAGLYCPQALQDSTEWAIVDSGPQNPLPAPDLFDPRWKKMKVINNSLNEIDIYKNFQVETDLSLNGLDNGCARYLKIGKYNVTIDALPVFSRQTCPTDRDLSIRINQNRKLVQEIRFNQSDLASQSGKLQTYHLSFEQNKTNGYVNLLFDTPVNLNLSVQKIRYSKVD